MKMTKAAKKSTKPMAAKTAKSPKPAMSMPMAMAMPMRGARTAKNMKTKGMR